MSAAPPISVIIPAFNAERFLAETIESLLAQTLPPMEIVLVDDGSTDGTAEVARRFGSRVNYQLRPHSGIAATRNHGLSVARGEWIAFLDADDVWLPDKLQLQAARLLAEPHLQYVTAQTEIFLEPGCERPPNYHPSYLEGKQFGLLSSFLGRKAVFETVGKFDTQFICAEDMDWFARAKDLRVPTVSLAEVLARKRVHSTNITVTVGVRVIQGEVLRIMKSTLDRQRQKAPAQIQ